MSLIVSGGTSPGCIVFASSRNSLGSSSAVNHYAGQCPAAVRHRVLHFFSSLTPFTQLVAGILDISIRHKCTHFRSLSPDRTVSGANVDRTIRNCAIGAKVYIVSFVPVSISIRIPATAVEDRTGVHYASNLRRRLEVIGRSYRAAAGIPGFVS